ncbi:MAG: endonuclease G [Psychromonas sp.]|jgi:endonuclease G
MERGFTFFRLCAALVFIIVGFFFVIEHSNINKAAEVTGMVDVIAQSKKDVNDFTGAFNPDENKYKTTLGKVFKREYQAYTLYISCLHRGPLYGFMSLKKDNGNLPRKTRFAVDIVVPSECRQVSTSSYNKTYHRGHLFAANHFDNDGLQMWESFFMSNVVPQHHVSNTGAWKKTEVITECYREHHSIYLAAGVIYGSDKSDDYFLRSHKVTTPTAMWKYIQLDNDKYSAWIIPNNEDATQKNLHSFEVKIQDLMRITNIEIVRNVDLLQRVQLNVFQNCHIS